MTEKPFEAALGIGSLRCVPGADAGAPGRMVTF